MPVVAATNAIVELVDAKGYIKYESTADDDIIQNIINGVSSLFEKYCGSKFINLAITEVVDGSGTQIQIVEYCPITALTEIKFYFDTATPVIQTITDFIFDGPAGMIKGKTGGFPEGWQNIQIIYTAGYGANIAALPDDLKLAAMKQCEFYYKRDAADFSATFEEGMLIKSPAELLSPVVLGMLSPYYHARF